MIRKRMLTLSTLGLGAAASAVVSLGGWNLPLFGAVAGETGSLEAAWALLAEAEELCRSKAGRPMARSAQSAQPGGVEGLGVGPAIARRAIALEALEIVDQLARAGSARRASISIQGRRQRLLVACAARAAAQGATTSLRRSLDGRSPEERLAMLTPYLERLNRAAAAATAATNPVARSVPTRPRVDRPDRTPKRPAPALPVQTVSAESSRVPRVPPVPPMASVASGASGAPAPSASASIKIAPATSGYRKRVRRWATVFEREAGALARKRSDLQRAIDRRSMVEARQACRRFGVVLARLDEDFLERAPSRGLALRIQKMVEHYWRGVAHCTAGRPAAAFSYLSEGDREWVTIAEMVSRMFEPTPFWRPRAGVNQAGETVPVAPD